MGVDNVDEARVIAMQFVGVYSYNWAYQQSAINGPARLATTASAFTVFLVEARDLAGISSLKDDIKPELVHVRGPREDGSREASKGVPCKPVHHKGCSV